MITGWDIWGKMGNALYLANAASFKRISASGVSTQEMKLAFVLPLVYLLF